MSLLGKTIGHIRIVDVLGSGGMGDVYEGIDETLERKVAVKAIRAKSRLDPQAKARFLREARVLSHFSFLNDRKDLANTFPTKLSPRYAQAM